MLDVKVAEAPMFCFGTADLVPESIAGKKMVSEGVQRLPKVTESDRGASVVSGNGTVARHTVDTSTRAPPGQGGAQTESRQNCCAFMSKSGRDAGGRGV